jgi:DNA invertase Pin-like site-specific DNA recombinase
VLEAVENGEVQAVVVFKSDRMSRDGIESLQIEKLMLRKNVDYLSATEGNLSGDSVDDEFMSFIRAGLNQRERKLISLRTRTALQRKKAKGERLGRPTFGWTVENGELVQVPEEQAAIDRILNLKGKGYSTREIVRQLAAEGVVTRTGRVFNQTEICRILKRAA